MSNPSSPAIESILPVPVLVVEDEPLLQQRLCAVLMQLGYAQDALLMAASLAEARACLAVQPVALVGVTPMLVVVPKNSPYNTLQELIAAAAKAAGKLAFCSGGQGTVQYMGAELFNQGVGIKMLHVPYRAGGLALQAILAGEVDMGFFNLPALSSHIKGGALKPLAITSAKRNPLFPNVPTISEAGVKNYEVYEWNGMFVPSTTPAEIVTRLNTAVREVLAMPEVKARFDALGSESVGSQPDEFRKRLAAESARWAETIKAAGIKKE